VVEEGGGLISNMYKVGGGGNNESENERGGVSCEMKRTTLTPWRIARPWNHIEFECSCLF
jgi:hypothetical protein